jgi:hypothetical protein
MACYIDQVPIALIALLLLAAVLAIADVLEIVERSRVSLGRMRRFARKHRLTVTAANGERVIRYLATTRRWRTVGLVAGLFSSVGWALWHGSVGFDFLTLFAGWFAGALVAEVRLARPRFGPRRAASLTTRAPAMYLPRWARSLVQVPAVVSVAAIAPLMLRGAGPAALVLGGTAAAIAVVVSFVQARVLRRPQPVDAPDVVAADDAIRSRSLHVLTGGGATLVLYCLLGQLTLLADLTSPEAHLQGWAGLGFFVVPLLGWSMATATWRVVRPAGEVGAL